MIASVELFVIRSDTLSTVKYVSWHPTKTHIKQNMALGCKMIASVESFVNCFNTLSTAKYDFWRPTETHIKQNIAL